VSFRLVFHRKQLITPTIKAPLAEENRSISLLHQAKLRSHLSSPPSRPREESRRCFVRPELLPLFCQSPCSALLALDLELGLHATPPPHTAASSPPRSLETLSIIALSSRAPVTALAFCHQDICRDCDYLPPHLSPVTSTSTSSNPNPSLSVQLTLPSTYTRTFSFETLGVHKTSPIGKNLA
jgi:hypothetical protein